ncbi:MAG: hypothetical protein OEY44_01905 [Candidatus Peregrinibacteria bacterium]|nr:hypothetical protein [Candidatus Peregrinibacteria bacterium]
MAKQESFVMTSDPLPQATLAQLSELVERTLPEDDVAGRRRLLDQLIGAKAALWHGLEEGIITHEQALRVWSLPVQERYGATNDIREALREAVQAA